MISQEDLQRAIDHFHIGRISELITHEDHFEIQTTQGRFLILESSPEMERMNNYNQDKKIEKIRNDRTLERLLFPDYSGKLIPGYAHIRRMYYSVYKIE